MSSLAVALIVFGCMFASAMLGLFLGTVLPAHHLDDDSKDVIKLGTGLVATIAALVLSLLISSAKSSFDKMRDELVASAAQLVLLDRTLAAYGPDASAVRDLLKRTYTDSVNLLFSNNRVKEAQLDTPQTIARTEKVVAQLRQLMPRNDEQRALQVQAVTMAGEIASRRWLLLLQEQDPVPFPLLVVLVSWLATIFAAFGLFAPRNPTAIVALSLAGLSAAGAIFLILEMNNPMNGFVRISDLPLRSAINHLGE